MPGRKEGPPGYRPDMPRKEKTPAPKEPVVDNAFIDDEREREEHATAAVTRAPLNRMSDELRQAIEAQEKAKLENNETIGGEVRPSAIATSRLEQPEDLAFGTPIIVEPTRVDERTTIAHPKSRAPSRRVRPLSMSGATAPLPQRPKSVYRHDIVDPAVNKQQTPPESASEPEEAAPFLELSAAEAQELSGKKNRPQITPETVQKNIPSKPHTEVEAQELRAVEHGLARIAAITPQEQEQIMRDIRSGRRTVLEVTGMMSLFQNTPASLETPAEADSTNAKRNIQQEVFSALSEADQAARSLLGVEGTSVSAPRPVYRQVIERGPSRLETPPPETPEPLPLPELQPETPPSRMKIFFSKLNPKNWFK